MIGALLRGLSRRGERLQPYLNRLRYELCRWRFDQAGPGGSLAGDVRISGSVCVRLAERVALRRGVFLGGHGEISIGAGTALNEGCIVTALERVEIGANCMLAPRVYILDVDHVFERTDIPIAEQGYEVAPVVIGDDVWIGTQAVICKGVSIGHGAVIGANSVVTRDIPAMAVAAGLPAKVIRMRQE